MTDGEDRLGSFDEPLSEDAADSPGEVPDATAPTVEPPRPDTPTTEAGESPAARLRDRYDDADPEFKTLFWKLVALYKLGIVGLTLGSLILLFDAHPTAGPVSLLGGLAFVGHALYLTRRGKSRLDDGDFDFDTEDAPESGRSRADTASSAPEESQ